MHLLSPLLQPHPHPPLPTCFSSRLPTSQRASPCIYIGRLCAPDYRASSQLFARVTTNLPAATLSIDASRFQKLMKLGPPPPSSPFQVGSPSFRAKSLDHSRFHRSSSLFLSFPMLMLTNACSIRFLPFSPFLSFLFFFLSFPRTKKSSVESRMERFGVIARSNWGKNSRGSDPALFPPPSSLYRSLLARGIRVNEEHR